MGCSGGRFIYICHPGYPISATGTIEFKMAAVSTKQSICLMSIKDQDRSTALKKGAFFGMIQKKVSLIQDHLDHSASKE